MEKIKAQRTAMTIILAAAGIGIMFYYKTCEAACSYLQGDIFGVDLSYIGVVYMLMIIIFAALRKVPYVRVLLASGIGVEVYLIAFQFREDVFCPYCLAFASTIIIAFILNHERDLAPERSWLNRIVYGLGAVELPPAANRPLPLLAFIILGYSFVAITFSGSATPAYGAEKSIVPSYGSGKYELIIFTDYFCPPCQSMESELDPAVKEFLSRGDVRVIFVDLPIHKETRLYAQYYLYAAKAAKNYENVLHARQVLFSLARNHAAQTEDDLKKALKAEGVPITVYDLSPVYPALNKIINTYQAKSTPTCIIKYSSDDIRKYVGTFEIRDGLGMLRATLTAKR
ncbi:MAG: thioredoxin domain-containing protein [Syntrophales bacterium]